MTITVSSGVTSGFLIISSGDPLVVLSGGEVISSIILSGGSATLSSGALGDVLTVSSGGVLDGPGALIGESVVGGTINGVTVSGPRSSGGISLELLSGGFASDVTVTASE